MKNGLMIENGDKIWYLNDKIHREDGPAAELNNGDKYWFYHGKWHREDGPAVEYIDGSKSWYLNGQYINCKSQKEFDKLVKLKAFW